MTSNLYSISLILVFLLSQLAVKTQAGDFPTSPLTSSSTAYGPVKRDCDHSRIVCIEGNQTIFAVKGPLTSRQAKHICPSTPMQTEFKRNRLPSNMLNPMLIVNEDKSIIEYSQLQNNIQKTASETLPKFSYLLCGTSDHKPNSGRHINANNPMPFDTFLDKSLAAEQVKNIPTYTKFEAPDRKFAFHEVALGDSLAYITTLIPSSEVNYEIVGTHIAGYHINAKHRDITGRFDQEERLYEFTASLQEENISLSSALNDLMELYGKPVAKGRYSLDHDLDPANNAKQGTYIWKIWEGAYLTISIDTTKNTNIMVKMLDISQAEKAAEYLSKIKKQI